MEHKQLDSPPYYTFYKPLGDIVTKEYIKFKSPRTEGMLISTRTTSIGTKEGLGGE